MSLVIDHDVRLKAHISQSVDALKVLFVCCVKISENEHLRIMPFVELSVEIVGKAFQPTKNFILLLLVIPCKVNG